VIDEVLASATHTGRDALLGVAGSDDAVVRVVDPVDCSVLAEAPLERADD
jgi:hypothetical protein